MEGQVEVRYVLYKKIDGEWYVEGRYSLDYINRLAYAAWNLGKYDCFEDIKVEVEKV